MYATTGVIQGKQILTDDYIFEQYNGKKVVITVLEDEELEEHREIFSMVQERMAHYDASKNVSLTSIRNGWCQKIGAILSGNMDLTGFYKLYAYGKSVRIIYRLLASEKIEIIEVWGIGKRDNLKVYKDVDGRNCT